MTSQQKLKQLREVEESSQQTLQKQLPVRRFGAGVDVRKQQQQVLQQREQARETLSKIPQEREKIKQQQVQQQRQEARQAELQKVQSVISTQQSRLSPGEVIEYNPNFARSLSPEAKAFYSKSIESLRNRGIISAESYFKGIEQKQEILSTEGVSSIVGGVVQFKPGYYGVSTAEGVMIEQIGGDGTAQDVFSRTTTHPQTALSPFLPGGSGTTTQPQQIDYALDEYRPISEPERIDIELDMYRESKQRPKGFIEGLYFDTTEAEVTRFVGDARGGATDILIGFSQNILEPILFGKMVGGALVTDISQKDYKFTESLEVGRDIRSALYDLPETIPQELTRYRKRPSILAGTIASELLIFKGFGVASKFLGRVKSVGKSRLSTKYAPVIDDAITIADVAGDTFDIKLGGAIGSKSLPTETIARQTLRAGTEIPTAVSGSKGLFGRFINREIKIDKALLDVVDSPLEKSFFFDPEGRLRISRLGIEGQKSAGLLDIFKGDFTFKKVRPQGIVLRKALVEDIPFPKIKQKLLTGKTLTHSESKQLLDFQLTPSGKLKPIGYLGGEPEVTLAPGELLGRKRTIGRTIIDDSGVEIIEAEIRKQKLSKTSTDLLGKKSLTSLEAERLSKNLLKETGIDYSYDLISKKYISRIRLGTSVTYGLSSLPSFSSSYSSGISRTKSSKTPSKSIYNPKIDLFPSPSSPEKDIGTSVYPSISKYTGYPGYSGTPKPPLYPVIPGYPSYPIPITPGTPIHRTKKKKGKKKRFEEDGFNVYGKVVKSKKFKKLNKRPVSKQRALDFGALVTDTSLARTFEIRPAKGKTGELSVPVPEGYFNNNRRKFRDYKVKKGKKVKRSSLRYIEKGMHLLDTKEEVAGINLEKRLTQLRKGGKKKKKK